MKLTHTEEAKALCFVSSMMEAKVFVMTATNMLINQKLRITRQTIKNRQEAKKSADII